MRRLLGPTMRFLLLAPLGGLSLAAAGARVPAPENLTLSSAERAPHPPRLALPSGDAPLEGGRRGSRSLVIVLHGGSFEPRPVVELQRDALTPLGSAADRAGLRLLVPAAPPSLSTTPWLEAEGEARVLALVAQQVKKKRADPRRVYLAGHGSGATAAIHLAARHPELFAAVACWSGTPSPLWDDEHRVVGLLGDPVPHLRDVPVYLWTATDDRWLDRATLNTFVAQFESAEAADPRFHLTWESGPGGHGYGGRDGPARGLGFLREHERREPRATSDEGASRSPRGSRATRKSRKTSQSAEDTR